MQLTQRGKKWLVNVGAVMVAALVLLAVWLLAMHNADASPADNPYQERRYCGEPARDSFNHIIRDAKVVREFRKLVACPSTLLRGGPCPGWALNHDWPLDRGGCDAVYNLSWMPVVLKASSGHLPIDRWELKVWDSTNKILIPMPLITPGHQLNYGFWP